MRAFEIFIWSFKRFIYKAPDSLAIDSSLSFKENILAIAYRDHEALAILAFNASLFLGGLLAMGILDFLMAYLNNSLVAIDALTILGYLVIILGFDIYKYNIKDNLLKLLYLFINIIIKGRLLVVYIFLILFENLVGYKKGRSDGFVL